VLLAEIEIRHSRPVAPTRRVALGALFLPTDPAPGYGPLLLAAVVGAGAQLLEDELRDGVDRLIDDLDRGRHVPQPRLRHRFQTDVVGLDRSRHRLVGEGERVSLEVDGHGAVLPQVLGVVYAAARLSYRARPAAFRLLRRATRWEGDADERLLQYLSGDEAAFRRWDSPGDEGWALRMLGFSIDSEPARSEILKRFRTLIRDAHPDHGGETDGAGQRIHELSEAKRILLAG
jgi:hypothetical protein